MSPFISRSGSAGARGFGLFLGGLKNISDLFTRTAGSLGISTSGHTWTALRGTWTTNGTQATSSDSASTYPIGSIPFQANITTSADVSGGVGLAFWTTDANNWWASYPTYIQNTINTCNTGYVSNTSNPPSGSCCSGVNSVAGSSTCNGTYVSNTSNPPSGSCCSGVGSAAGSTNCDADYRTLTSPAFCGGYTTNPGGTTCTGSTVSCTDSSNTCSPGGCGTVSSSGGTTCTGSTVQCVDTSNTCSPGGCGTISSSQVTSFSCPNPAYPYLCPGQTCNELPGCGGASISATAGTTTYTRTQNTDVTSYTRTQATNVTTSTTYSGYIATSTSPTTYNCYTSYTTGPTTYNCYTSTTASYTYDTRIVVVSSVSGSVVTDSTTTLVSGAGSLSPVNSLKVATSGDQITTTAYSSAGLVSQLGSPVVRTPTTPTKGPSVGIIKGPSTYNQGSTIDNYSTTKP